MKKVFFFDIDGTILDSSRGMTEVSKKTLYAFKQLMKDNYVLIASGRCKGLLNEKIRALPVNGYVLCNGAYAELNNKVIFSKTFTSFEIDKIKSITKELEGFWIGETLDNIYVEDLNDPLLKKFFDGWNTIPDCTKQDPDIVEGLHIFMVGFRNEELTQKAQERLSEIAGVDRHFWFFSHDINIDGINKGVGCRKVIENLSIDLKDSYAFGDGINDLQMMEAVGHPIIVENASPVMKNRGFEETDDVLKEGVYNYLVKNHLIPPME